MSQTREERIYKHYRSLIKRHGSRGDSDTLYPEERAAHINTYVWMFMARRWQMPVRFVKNIVSEYRSEHGIQG